MLAAAPAMAVNGNLPRTPPVFPPHACLGVVDRSVDATYVFKVGIPYEDVVVTADELPDSRTFEFFAFCRGDPPETPYPNWIDMEDAQRALAIGSISELPPPDTVLETAERWAIGHDGVDGSCVQSIGPRIPISCDATQDGVAWDTTGVPAGNYVILGYTFSPATNLWTPRTGVVQVHDGTPTPVAAFASPVYDAQVFQQTGYRVLGCMGGPPGTQVTLAWASIADELDGDVAGVWTDFAELDAADGVFDVQLVPPESAVYLGLVLRATARDDTSSWVAYSSGFLTIYPGDDESDDPEVPPGPDRCEVGEEPTAGLELDEGGDASSDASTTSDPQEDANGHDGCGCDAHGGEPSHLAAFMGLWLCGALARRRARARAIATDREPRPASIVPKLRRA